MSAYAISYKQHIARKPIYVFIDGHDSHWDRDALQLMLDNQVFVTFLRSNNSGQFLRTCGIMRSNDAFCINFM